MKFLIVFSATYQTFRLQELDAIATLFGFPIGYGAPVDLDNSCMVVDLASEREAKLLGSRSILIKSVWEYWADAPSYTELHANLQARPQLYSQYVQDTSFKIRLISINKTIKSEEQAPLINTFAYLGFKGPIRMSDPEEEFGIVEYHALNPSKARSETLRQVFFGRKICDSQRHLKDVFDVKKRQYIGNTSMDAEVSLLMANQALARNGSLVYDPFAGTGSMLYVCAHFGAFVLGSDIDGRHMRGKNGQSIVTAASQYGTRSQVLDLMTFDMAQNPWREEGFLDAIVTDPPYGVRAGAKRLGRKNHDKLRAEPYKMPDGTYSHEAADYVPPSQAWEMSEVLDELLAFSYRMLKPGGRLVYWLPTITEEFKIDDIPAHPGMRLVADSEQQFSKWSRHLVTMEKALVANGVAARSEDKPAHFAFRERYFSKFI